MLKWILRFFYIMIISVATLYVYGSANYGRLEAYYAKYLANDLDNDTTYLNGINTLMNLAYYQETPVYQFQSDSETHHLKLSIHAIGITNKDVYYDGLMIFVNELEIYQDEALIEKPILQITAHLSDATYKSNNELIKSPSIIYDSTKEFPYSYAPTLFLVYAPDYLQIPDTESFSTIERIDVSYSDGTKGEDGKFVFDTNYLFTGSDHVIDENAYNKVSDLSLDASDFRLTQTYGEELSQNEIETLGLVTDRGSLKEFNGVIVKTMAIYTLIVLALTYILFFHKMVVEKIKEKRYSKQIATSEGPTEEAIFQDIEYKDENKK